MIDIILLVFTIAVFAGGAFFGHYVATNYGTWSTYIRAASEKVKTWLRRK